LKDWLPIFMQQAIFNLTSFLGDGVTGGQVQNHLVESCCPVAWLCQVNPGEHHRSPDLSHSPSLLTRFTFFQDPAFPRMSRQRSFTGISALRAVVAPALHTLLTAFIVPSTNQIFAPEAQPCLCRVGCSKHRSGHSLC